MNTTQQVIDAKLFQFGARLTPAQVEPGQSYWRLISALGPLDWGGRHGIYVDVRYESGERIVGAPVSFWNGGINTKLTEAKPGEPFAVDFPIFAAGNAYGCKVADGKPSDSLFGMGLVAFEKHASFQLVFQLAIAAGEPSEPPRPPATMTALEAIEKAQTYLDLAKGLLT